MTRALISWGNLRAIKSEVLEKYPMKQMKAFTGKWRIVEMEVWEQDYAAMHCQLILPSVRSDYLTRA